MKKTGVEVLVEDMALSIADSWLKLDEINTKFQCNLEKIKESRVYVPKISQRPPSMKEQALFDQNNFYEQVLDIDNDEQTKNSVFQYYFSEQRTLFESLYPDMSSSEIRVNAAACFKSLPTQEKAFYMKQFLKDKYYNNQNSAGGHKQSYHMQNEVFSFNAGNYRFPEVQQNMSIPSLFDRVENGSGRSDPKVIQQFYNKNDFQGFLPREKSGQQTGNSSKKQSSNSFSNNENRSKTDSSKPSSSGQGTSKSDDAKQKPEFQTLRSLFKRLQSNI